MKLAYLFYFTIVHNLYFDIFMLFVLFVYIRYRYRYEISNLLNEFAQSCNSHDFKFSITLKYHSIKSSQYV